MLGFGGKEEPDLNLFQKIKYFFVAHWRGVVIVILPLALLGMVAPFPGKAHTWCAYTLIIMGVFWVTECIPLAVTGFIPVIIFPLTGVMSSADTCLCYMNDSVMLFVGSLMLAASVEQCGLHKRLAYCAIRIVGYSHYKLLFALCSVTTFVSLWITNTAATTMMVPINFALLRVFETQGIARLHEKNAEGDLIASDITTCYFCAAAFSATIGGIGTLVGTGTNLVFKGLFVTEYPAAPEYLSFPLFSAFAIPYMIVLSAANYLNLVILYFGFLRPNSPEAKSSHIPVKVQEAAKAAIDEKWKQLGKLSYWEMMVILLFGGCMISFFCRSPQMFDGWGDKIINFFGLKNKKFVEDSSLAFLVLVMMCTLPATCEFTKHFKANDYDDLPKGTAKSVLDWRTVNMTMPFSFMFLLGGGFALSTAAKTSGLNGKIGESIQKLASLPNYAVLFLVIVVVIFITNFASNVAVANVMCPIAMELAKQIKQNPLWYNIAAGYTASYCFIIPVGTPPNLIVQSAAKIPTKKMMKSGTGLTIATIFITWVAICFWAPVVWPDLHKMPSWTTGKALPP